MHKSFLAFNERAIASEVHKSDITLANHLEETANMLADLAKNSANEATANCEDEQALPPHSMEAQDQRPHIDGETASSQPNQVSVFGYETSFEEDDYDVGTVGQQFPATQARMESLNLPEWMSSEAVQQFQTRMPATTDDTNDPLERLPEYSEAAQTTNPVQLSSTEVIMQHNPQGTRDQNLQDRGWSTTITSNQSSSDNNAVLGGNLSNTMTLPNPESYASHEASFARRLMRSSLEEGYRLMTSPRTSPTEIKRAYRFSLCFAKSSRIVHHMKSVMGRTGSQNFELWNVPQYHLGGAGLHYPRVGIDSGSAPPAWWSNKAPIGPLPPPPPENPMPNSSVCEIAEKVDFGGEWFDSNDVEQYLRSKGLYLDGQSSIVELADEEPAPAWNDIQPPSTTSPADSSSHESSRDPRSPPDLETGMHGDAFSRGAEAPWNFPATEMPQIADVNMDLARNDPGSVDQKPISPSLDFSMLPDTLPTFKIRMKKFLDVEKFVKST